MAALETSPYKWGINCCMSTAARLTQINGGDSTLMQESLDMNEATAIRHYLRKYGTIGMAYHHVLSECGWVDVTDQDHTVRNGDMAIVDGESIETTNGGIHLPRGLIQVLAFYMESKWSIWTEEGLCPINWAKSDADLVAVFQW